MSFPRIDDERRTDLSFRNRRQISHHKEYSLLERLNIDMVEQFPTSDPMHLLELGIMKRTFTMWVKGGWNFQHKLTDNDLVVLNRRLFAMNRDMPIEIHRSIRPTQALKHWKATEFRTMLLYAGMVAFKNILRNDEYQHFLKLVCSVHICTTDKYRLFIQIAKLIFHDYIEGYIDLYGIDSIGSNVHNLCHIIEDVERFGNLMTISTYPFENTLRLLKLKLRTCRRPLEQISRRLDEALFNINSQNKNTIKKFEILMKHSFQVTVGQLVFRTITIKPNVTLSSKKNGDRWYLNTNQEIMEFMYATRSESGQIKINSREMKEKSDFFKNPMSSSKLHIYESPIGSAKGIEDFYDKNTIMCKLICITHEDKFVFMPLLHSFD